MGFEDQAADTGAELTNLKKKEPLLYSESQGAPWTAIDLLAEKKKDEQLGLGYEPVHYALKGAEPQIVSGDAKVEIQAPKKFAGSSMARNVVEEPVGEKTPIFALKTTKPDALPLKPFVEGYPQVGTFAAGEHMFVNKKLSPEQAIIDKKQALTQVADSEFKPTFTKSDAKFGFASAEGQFVPVNQAVDAGPVKFKTPQFGEGPELVKLKSDLKSEGFPAAAQSGGSFANLPVEKGVLKAEHGFVIENGGGTSFAQRGVTEKFSTASVEKTGGFGVPALGSNTAERLTAMGGGPVIDKDASPKVLSQMGSPVVGSPLQQIESATNRRFTSEVVQTQIPLANEQQGSSLFQPKKEHFVQPVQTQIALSEPKKFVADQQLNPVQQIAAAGPQTFEPIKTKVATAGQAGQLFEAQLNQPQRLNTLVDGKVGGTVPILKQEPVSTPVRTQALTQQAALKVDSPAPRAELAINRVATLHDQTTARRQDLRTATTGNGIGGNGLAVRQPEIVPASTRKVAQEAQVGPQVGLSRTTGLEQSLPGKKLIPENTALTELPTKFSKTTQLTQIDKLASDAQLRAQTDRIAASSQLKALGDQSSVKLKGEITSTSFRPTDHVAAVKPGQQLLDNGLTVRTAPIKAVQQQQIDNGLQPRVAPVKAAAQQQFESGLQPRVTPIKAAAQQQFESGLQPRVTPIKAAAQQQFESGLQPRIAPLTGKTTQDLVAALKPQDRIAAVHNQSTDLNAVNDRRIAASVVRNGADALSTPYTIDRATRMGNAHIVSGDVKVLSGKFAAVSNANDVLAGDRKVAHASQISALLGNVKDGKGDISRSLSFEHLMSSPVKSTQDRYVGGEFLLASMIIAAGAARRMPEQRAEGQAGNTGARGIQATAEVAEVKRGDKSVVTAPGTLDNSGKTVKASPFSQIVDIIARGFAAGRTSEQTQAIEASRRDTFNQGQNDSVRYITGVELAILLAAGGVSRLRSEKMEGQIGSKTQSQVQPQDDAAAKQTKVSSASTINFNNGKQPLNAGADTHITTRIVANMSGQRADFTLTNAQPQIQNQIQPPRMDVSASASKGDKATAQPAGLSVRGERCIPGADVAIAAMLMLGGAARKRNGESVPAFPTNPDELAEKVDRPFRLDRRLGEIVAQAKSFVAREPMPISGLRATCANLVATGDVIVPPQYKQGSQEKVEQTQHMQNVQHFAAPKVHDNSAGKKSTQEFVEALLAPTGWVHEPALNKETVEEASEEKLKKVEQDQQEGAGSGTASTLYRPIWIIAPGETFVSIAEDQFGDGAIAWLIADLNIGKFTDSTVEGKRVIEIQSRQRIELPVASDIEEFRHKRQRHQDAENIITIVTASQLDIELKQATFKQFLGTLQNNLPVPGVAVLPQLDLVTPQKPLRAAAPFGMSAPQFASIAAAVSLPLIVPQMDMLQQSADTNTAHIQEVRSESAKPEESV